MDKWDYIIGISALLLIGMLATIPSGERAVSIPPQAIVKFQTTEDILPQNFPKPDNTLIAAQSIVGVAIPEFVGNTITFTEGPSTITKLWFGIPRFFYMIAIGIILVHIVLLFVRVEIKEIEESNTFMNTMNTIWIILIVLIALYTGLLMTRGDMRYAVFYIIFAISGPAFLALLKHRFKKNFNICVNDRILGFWDVLWTTQVILIVFSTIGIMLLMTISNANMAAFSTGGSKINSLIPVLPENQLLLNIPTYLALVVGMIVLAALIGLIYQNKVIGVMEAINKHPQLMFSGMVVIIVLTSVGLSYCWASYHEAVYSGYAEVYAAETGRPVEEVKAEMIRSVSDFAAYSVWGIVISGSTLPADGVHFCVNYLSSG